jgi:hypothetical protein
MPQDERDVRRAAADPAFRAAWLRRAQAAARRLGAAMLDPESDWVEIERDHAALRQQVARVSSRATVPQLPAHGVCALAGGRDMWWPTLPAAIRCRRCTDSWYVRPTTGSSHIVAIAGQRVWADSGRPVYGRYQGRAERYEPAEHGTYVRARWVVVDGRTHVTVHDVTSSIDDVPADDELVIVTPDRAAKIGRLREVDGVRWYVARPELVHGLRVARGIGPRAVGTWIVDSARRTYHATGCASPREAARQALVAWRAQRREWRATVDPRARVSIVHTRLAGYCDPGVMAFARELRIPAHRVQSGVPAGIIMRRTDDQRALRVCRLASTT